MNIDRLVEPVVIRTRYDVEIHQQNKIRLNRSMFHGAKKPNQILIDLKTRNREVDHERSYSANAYR